MVILIILKALNLCSFVNVLKVLTAHVGGTVTGSIYYDGNLPLEMNKFIVVINEL